MKGKNNNITYVLVSVIIENIPLKAKILEICVKNRIFGYALKSEKE
jgi:hypothetical protein